LKRVAILISGGGSNMVELCKSMQMDHPAKPVLVMSNDPQAGGLKAAADMGIAVDAVDHKPFGQDRAAFENLLIKKLKQAEADVICLAGFMRILTSGFVIEGDTPQSLADRVLVQEHRLYPAVLKRFCAGERSLLTMT
jgi:phosphoribosylglycinamide formyltransferase-1